MLLGTVLGARNLVEAASTDKRRSAVLSSVGVNESTDGEGAARGRGEDGYIFTPLYSTEQGLIVFIEKDVMSTVATFGSVAVDGGNPEFSAKKLSDKPVRSGVWAREKNKHALGELWRVEPLASLGAQALLA